MGDMINKIFNVIRRVCITLLLLSASMQANAQDIQECFDEKDLERYSQVHRKLILFRSKPIINGYWNGPLPTVRLCKDSGVSKVRLEKAVRYWEKLGYEFGNIIIETNQYSCLNNGFFGEITVLLFDQITISSDHLAVTRTHKMTETKEIVKAEIFINKKSAEKPLVLEHELGHALGWVHYNTRYHIMNSRYPLCGHASSGLERRNYDIEVNRIILESKH